MRIKIAAVLILAIFHLLFFISASEYQIEYSQIKDKLVIKEIVDGIKISNYVSPEILEKSSSGYYFVKKIVFNESYSKAEIRLILDEGIILENEEVYPTNYRLETNGRTINIIWELENLQKNQAFAMFVKLEDTQKEFSWFYWVIGLAFIILAAYLLYNKFIKPEKANINSEHKKNKIKALVKEEIKYEHLLDSEKQVIEELKKADRNELWQKQIQNLIGFSKAKVSRLVRNLEARNLVSKIPFGNTNKVRLK